MIGFNRSEICSFDVDAQRGFTPICPGELPVEGGDKIVDELNAQARFASIRVGSKDAHPPNGAWIAEYPMFPQFSEVSPKLPNVDIRWNRHCEVGTIGFKLLDGLPNPIDYDYFIWKGVEHDLHPYSAVYHGLNKKLSTGVIEFLKYRGIKLIIVGGLALSFCVKATAVDLKDAGFEVVINLAACKDLPGFKEETDIIFKEKGILLVDRYEGQFNLGVMA